MSEDDTSMVVPLKRCWHVIRELDLIALGAAHSKVRQLCEVLEGQADRLPGDRASLTTNRCCEALILELENLQALGVEMDARLFGAEQDQLTRTLLELICQARAARLTDVEDLRSALNETGHRVSVDALGYMMRAVFEGCRRMIAFEDVSLMLLAAPRLDGAARSVLLNSLLAACDAL